MKRVATGKRAVSRTTALGREIIADLTELAETLERGESPADRFIVRTVELPDEPTTASLPVTAREAPCIL